MRRERGWWEFSAMKYEEMTEAQRRAWGFIKLSKQDVATINIMKNTRMAGEDGLNKNVIHLNIKMQKE
jgi:hypothetical protein